MTTILYQIYERSPSYGDGLICEGFDRAATIEEAIEYVKDRAHDDEYTEWELDVNLVEWDWDNDVKISEKKIYKCGVLN